MSDAPKKPSYPKVPSLHEPKGPLPPRASGPDYYATKEVPAFKGNTPESLLMSETMRRLETMHQDVLKSVESIRSEVKTELQKNEARSLEAHERTRRHVTALTHMFRVLWTTVKGSEPPPPPPPGSELVPSMSEPIPKTALVPIDEQISNHDLSLAAFEGRLIAVSATANETKSQVGELLSLQKEQMGKHEAGIAVVKRLADTMNWLLTTADGRRSLMIFVMFVAVVYDKLRGIVHR